jgi:hypothetical protein
MTVVMSSVGVAQGADSRSSKEVKPTIMERLTKDAIDGTLIKMDGEYYSIKDHDGVETRIHVDQSTKLDKVIIGDQVKAYVNDKGHATTLLRE